MLVALDGLDVYRLIIAALLMDQILVRGANKSISRSSGFDLSALNWHRTRMVTRGSKIQARLSLAKSGRDETKKKGGVA